MSEASSLGSVATHYRECEVACGTAPEGKLRARLLVAEGSRQHPLVVYLHGSGERGEDNRAQLRYLPEWTLEAPWRKEHPVFLLAPQCPAGRRWSSLSWDEPARPLPASPVSELRSVLGLVDQVFREYPVDGRRIYLTGISMGGFGAWELAAREPRRWAAVVPICGGGDPASAARFCDVPLWAFHGACDDVVPPERSRDMIKAVQKAGGDPRYTEYTDCGHDSWTPAYHETRLFEWLFRQRRAPLHGREGW